MDAFPLASHPPIDVICFPFYFSISSLVCYTFAPGAPRRLFSDPPTLSSFPLFILLRRLLLDFSLCQI